MGNCLRRHAHDPNQPIDDIPQRPSAGVDGIQYSRGKKNSMSLQRNTSSNTLKVVTNQCKNEACHHPLQERNTPVSASSSHKERHSQAGKDGTLVSPKDWSVSTVNKKGEVFYSHKLNCFCYSVLKSATQKFSAKNLIGQGGFGDVYKGYINLCTMDAAKPSDGGIAVAVKRLRSNRTQGHSEWENEMKFLSLLNHPNIVKLIGHCCEGEHRMLVYEYMTRGSLEAHLLRKNDTELNWKRRINIALGVARGLEYLHTRGKPVIHRDLKASNVLLGKDFNAKLSDFGLAKFGPQDDETHIITRVVGTRGYFAPEYFATGHLTLKTDVFSFGVVLLEILSGCEAIKKHSDGVATDLAQWSKPHLSNKVELHRVVDKKLGSIPMEEAQDFAEVILRCLGSNPRTRPTMTEVVADLEKLQQRMDCYNSTQLRYLHTRK
ncbi:probable serine/threonine-protein kinase PBL11 [Hevea brasiliensis]|uniref:probable serine/threonine-protein kinase PBL11 n=1 Tax=Hevea brasiliensis TaxID=3981 RepID=UPI0025F0C62C|nr:probable serine/threonine-protein kinase PBL11 [Hevea brasiliensis]